MKKVFLIHGFEGSPNGGWRPWLMAELGKLDIYACALAMPNPDNPICDEWVDEITRNVEKNQSDEIYLIGHSLGAPTILRYLEKSSGKIAGVILVSSPSEKNNNKKIDSFLENPFNFSAIKSKTNNICIIHGENDPNVPLNNAEFLSKELNCNFVIIPNGGHLNGSSGWTILPQVLEELKKMFK
ncbi:MAG: alpha/beta fold hydrolase [Candidatus Paceibacterota bacterium]